MIFQMCNYGVLIYLVLYFLFYIESLGDMYIITYVI